MTADGNERCAVDAELDGVAELCLANSALDAYIVDTEERKASVWTARGAFLEAIKSSTTEMDECDVVVPRNKVAEFVLYTHALSKELNVRLPSFGHAGDGNLHVYICRDDQNEADWKKTVKIAFERLYAKAAKLNGLVSGEHGIGYAKRAYMADAYGDMTIEIMRRIKQAFDPNNILNPGKAV